MASETDDVLVVNEHTSDVRHGARNRGDVIDLSDSDDDVQVIPDVAAHPASQADAKYSMDCCGAVASIEGVQTAVESAAAGETILDVCTAIVCPACGKPLSVRDVRGAVPGSDSSTLHKIMEKLQQLALSSLQSKDATDAVAAVLKNGWFLSRLSLTQIRTSLRRMGLEASGNRATCLERLLDNSAVKQAMQQLAPAIGLMGVIMHLRLLVLGRLPDENYVTRSTTDATAAKEHQIQVDDDDDDGYQPLYSLQLIGSSKPTAGNGADTKKRPANSRGNTGSQPTAKKKKHSSKENRSNAAAGSVTQAAVAKGVGYGGGMSGMGGMGYGLPPHPEGVHPNVAIAGLPGMSAVAHMSGILGLGLPGMGWGGGSVMLQPPEGSRDRSVRQKQQHVRVQQQLQAQKEKVACIQALMQSLKASCTNPVMGPMPAPLAVMLHGGLSSVLHDLLEDSIDALLDDAAVQRPLLTLLEALSVHLPLIPVLTAKSSWPDHLLPAEDRDAENSAPHSGTSIADRLSSMRAGCDLWQREGQQMLNDEDEAGPSNQACGRDSANDIALVLHASNVGDTVQGAVEAAAHYKEEAAEPPPAAASTKKPTRQSMKQAKAEGTSAQQAEDAAMREQHAVVMHKHALFQASLEENHAFRTEAAQSAKHHSESHAKRNKVIMKQLTSLSSSLPAHFESSVHVAVSTERTDMARVLILAGPDTPYAYGAFVFDVFFPFTYPNVPPKMKFLTTGGGTVRFNPNLYNDGKVCLSLLGTWSGPSWNPAHSTFLQVLVSLQAMVFCEHPYFNEPGYERTAGSHQGETASKGYNTQIRHSTVKHAIYACLNDPNGHPHGVFKDVLDLHWRAKSALLKEYLKEHKLPLSKEISAKLDNLLQKSA